MTNSFALVEMMMDVERWVDTFSGLVARSSLLEVISYGVNGSKDGTLLLMQADFQVISPMVPVRQTKFLRFCKQRAEGVWAVVDVSLDASHEGSSSYSLPTSVRLPSGCIIEDIANGSCKVTWLEHSEYDESLIHGMLRPVISSGLGFGAKRWVTTLQRYCQCLNILMASATMPEDPSLMTMAGRKSVLRLAHRMVQNFCSGVYNGIGSRKWEKLTVSSVSEDVKILTRKSINEPGEPSGVVLVATTSVWLPITKERVFYFLAEDGNRKHWDILSNGGMMPEMFRITKSQDFGNNVSLNFDTNNADPMNQMVILQEMCDDASGSMLVYAPVDVPSMELTLNGGDHTYVCLLPSGFSIIPDGRDHIMATNEVVGNHGGCILTIGFQILVSSLPAAKLTMESVDTVSSLLSCTIHRIKEALNLTA
ncbi:Homeobox-leucine zipper protein ROC5 [Linum perenne]